MSNPLRLKVFQFLDPSVIESRAEKRFNVFLLTLIFLNMLAVILETEEVLFVRYRPYFHWFDVFSVAVFSVEYILRLWSCVENGKYKHPIAGRLRYASTPLAVVDLMAVLPFYLPMVFPFDLRFMRALRLFRIFRLFKIGRYVKSLKAIRNVFSDKKEELWITIFAIILLLVLASSLMYFVEREAQPDKFTSIPAAMWWGVCTLTTIGYGDMVPVTTMGKILGGLIALLGIGLFALPAGILASGFSAELQKRHKKEHSCPHCGKPLD